MATDDNTLRQRTQHEQEKPPIGSDVDSDDDRSIDRTEAMLAAKEISKGGTDHTPSVLKMILAPLPPRWQNWLVRNIFGMGMIGGFVYVIMMGPIALMMLMAKLGNTRNLHMAHDCFIRRHYLHWALGAHV
ncbi:unnamed protein product, partial [Meganyctiphanes norvegica]